MNGVIENGWAWAAAAYSLSWVAWVLYIGSLALRARRS